LSSLSKGGLSFATRESRAFSLRAKESGWGRRASQSRYLSEILTLERHRVTLAGSGHEALRRMEAEDFDVILTDIRMPDLDGRALYQQIERRWPGRTRRVVFVTGDPLASTLHEFVSESGRPVIEKPFLPEEVCCVVAVVAAQAQRGGFQ